MIVGGGPFVALTPTPMVWGVGGCLQRGEYCVVMVLVLAACVAGLWV